MVLETTECIEINNKGRKYTDCMEFSLLRFIQLIGFCPKQLDTKGYSQYNTKTNDNLICEFIKSYPNIYKSADYYLHDEDGTDEREKWSEFVSDRDFLEYYRNDQAELFTSITNILKFFINFYKLELDLNEYSGSLNKIANYFSTQDKKIQIKIKNTSITNKKMTMKEINNLLSRPDDEIKQFNNILQTHMVVFTNNLIEFSINDYNYEWSLYEVYFNDSNLFKNKYITGHSVINKMK